MHIKFIEYYIIFIYYFGVHLSNHNKKVFAEFYMNLLNKISFEKSYAKMLTNATYVYHKHIMEKLLFDDDIKNVEIDYNVINDNNVTYTITCMLNMHKHKFVIQYSYNDKIKNLISSHKNKDVQYNLLLYYYILDFERILFLGPDPETYKSFEATCISINKKYFPELNEHRNQVVECFAGIFNHTCENFYSLLDLEKHYGSKGNFFDMFLKDDYFMYLINPPYTDILLVEVFDMVIKKLMNKDNKYFIVLYIPCWNDILDPFYKELDSKRINYKKYKLKSHYVYNHYKEERRCRYLNTIIIACFNFMADNTYIDHFKQEVLKMHCEMTVKKDDDEDDDSKEVEFIKHSCVHLDDNTVNKYMILKGDNTTSNQRKNVAKKSKKTVVQKYKKSTKN